MEILAVVGDLGLNVVDEAETQRCRDMFTFYDEDKDGKLTYGEMLTCLRCCGRNPSVHEYKEIVQVIDVRLVRAAAARVPRRNLSRITHGARTHEGGRVVWAPVLFGTIGPLPLCRLSREGRSPLLAGGRARL